MKPSKSQQKPACKPLSIEMENAIDLLIQGRSDKETAEAIGCHRTTVQQWRTIHVVFMTELERRRAEIWRAPQERLRLLLSKAVENLAAAVEEGDLKASIEVLKAVGMYGQGSMNAIGEQDPEKLIAAQAEAQAKREGISEDPTHDMLIDMTKNPAYRRRIDEVKAALAAEYFDQP
jgi:hypothetical protein